MINVLKNRTEIIIKGEYIFIKNYKKLIDVNEDSIYLITSDNSIHIKGNNMIVKAMDEYDIVIKGNIKSIEYING